MDMTALVDHYNYDLATGTFPTDKPGRLVIAQHNDRTRFIHPSSHVVNVDHGKQGPKSLQPHFKLWLCDVNDKASPDSPSPENFYLRSEDFAYTSFLGERVIPAGFELWGQGSEGSALNYFFTVKEQPQ